MNFISKKKSGILELLNPLIKLFFTNEHQAAGIDVIDPIIIEEESISPRYISQIISLHKHSILRPVIIIILKDNDFVRAKDILGTCPHGLNVKFIRNSGETEIIKIINTGPKKIENSKMLPKDKCITLLSNADENSKYNVKNVTRYVKEKDVCQVLYNPTFMEAASEAGVATYFLKTRLSNSANDKNSAFIKSIEQLAKAVDYKLEELKYKA